MNPKSSPQGGFILNIAIIVVILFLVFLSQQGYFQKLAGEFYDWLWQKAEFYWNTAKNWFLQKIWPDVASEVEKRGEAVKEVVKEQKDSVVKSFWAKTKNYFAEKFSGIFKTELEDGGTE